MQKTYSYYKNILQNSPLPTAILDLDFLNENISALLTRSRQTSIRVASKSLRCPYVIEHILKSNKQFQGIMAFTVPEAIFLLEKGFDNILMGYPSMQERNIDALLKQTKKGKLIIPMVDCQEHLASMDKLAKENDVVQPICVDIDMSTDFPSLHFGVYRSPINSVAKFKNFLTHLRQYKNLKLIGLMGYEAQIAGLADQADFFVKNKVIQSLQNISISSFSTRRKKCVALAEAEGHNLSLINGGGTGSIETTIKEKYITEITVGSGFYSPGLFDNYSSFKHQPALFYALEVVRSPKKDILTALGGGYVASGGIGIDKQPKPFLPKGMSLTTNEGTGEVQTPFHYKGTDKIALGEPVFFRHAKAGELCERFNEITIISEGKIIDKKPTYRGLGQCFL